MAETAKRMGRPPGEPFKVVRLPLPVAALAKRLAEKSLRAGGHQRLLRYRDQAARYGASDGDFGRLRLSLSGG